MGFLEILISTVILISGLVWIWQLAKNGIFEVTLQRPPNVAVWNSWFICVTAIVIGGIFQNGNHFKSQLLTNKTGIIFIGILLVFYFLSKYCFLSKGTPQYNRAHIRTTFWMQTYYSHGVKDEEKGEVLANYSKAQKTLELFKKAIEARQKGSRSGFITTSTEIDQGRADYDSTNHVACPYCSMNIKVPIVYSYGSAQGQGYGVCGMCGCSLSYKIHENKIHLTAYGPKVVTVTPAHKIDIATAYSEMALLLRMMNKFDEAKNSLNNAESVVDKLLESDASNQNYLATKGVILFRLGELAHVEKNYPEAKRLYQESWEIDLKIGRHNDDQLMERLINEVS